MVNRRDGVRLVMAYLTIWPNPLDIWRFQVTLRRLITSHIIPFNFYEGLILLFALPLQDRSASSTITQIYAP